MQIKINLQVFLLIFIFILTHQIEIYSYIMAFTFVHELGHMCAGVILKLKPKSLKLMPLGISIMFEDYGYKKLIEVKKIIIALAGPFTNILLIIIGIVFNLNEEILYSNILIAVFNLIPLYPLDGGRILKSIIRINNNELIADKIVNIISNIVIILITAICSVFILYIKNLAILFILTYLWIIIIQENKRYNIKKMMYDTLKKNKYIDI